ncbi:Uncharacterized protein FWK35_00032797 [Aphis craccivora]|uniref:THAP-type domain-containing protein n=1 Tax=Aphis craccivora TaxID=307492 RepID=A0A6G0VM34_APHCR|nr:Uncharacterized protein FWK35_00032797 [Aphis craccivora]
MKVKSIPIISLSDLKEIIRDPANSSQRIIKITKLKETIDMINTIMLILPYLIVSYIAKRLDHKTKCEMCIRRLKTLNTSSQDCIGKEADLIGAKSKGYLTYPDGNLFIIIKHIENVLQYILKFACTNSEHKTNMLTNIFTYYITMSMRQYSYMQNQKNQKINKTKKNLSKLCY